MFGIKGMILAIIAMVSLIALAIVARNWSCRKQPEPRPPRITSYEVASVPTGVSILVRTGLRGRRTATVTLSGIAAPESGNQYAEPSRASLERLAGTTVRVESPRRRLLGDSDVNEAETELESRGDTTAVVYGEAGACLNLSQAVDGWAICLPNAPKEWGIAEKEAKKAKKGIWK